MPENCDRCGKDERVFTDDINRRLCEECLINVQIHREDIDWKGFTIQCKWCPRHTRYGRVEIRVHEYEEHPEHHVHDYYWSRSCGAQVCGTCSYHDGLARCFCGWSASGGDGARELVEMGECIDADY